RSARRARSGRSAPRAPPRPAPPSRPPPARRGTANRAPPRSRAPRTSPGRARTRRAAGRSGRRSRPRRASGGRAASGGPAGRRRARRVCGGAGARGARSRARGAGRPARGPRASWRRARAAPSLEAGAAARRRPPSRGRGVPRWRAQSSSDVLRVLARERGQRLHGGGLLRGLLAPADAAAEPPPRDRDLGDEALLVVGPALLDQRVGRDLAEEPLGQLLELGLVVAEPDAQVLEDAGGEVRLDHGARPFVRSEEHTSELQSLRHLVCRLLLEKKKNAHRDAHWHHTL